MTKTVVALFLALACLAVAAHARMLRFGGVYVVPKINSVTFGTPFKYSSLYGSGIPPGHSVNADGMSNTWADDDNIYLNLDDTVAGFDNAYSGGRNTMFGKLSTYDQSSIGSNVNDMAAWGTMTQNTGADNSSHKIAGVISIQGTMYAWDWRLRANGSYTSGNATLLKSVHAASWTPVPPATALPYASPMFPGNPIPMGFVQYGKDYSMIGGGALPDNASNYVYTTVIDNGGTASSWQDEWLGRCLISAIGNQSAADWTFWKGGDGMLDSSWGTLAQRQSMLHITAPQPGTNTAIYYWNVVWLPRYQQYLAINDADIPVNQTWTPYVAPHPWGPWRALPSTQYPSGSAMPIATFPNPATKSLTVDGGHTMYVYGSGDNGGGVGQAVNPNGGTYTLWITPATVN